jgi:hypothetical protein
LNGAIAFADFLLSTNGKDILKDQGLNPIKPLIEGDTARLPSTLRNIITNIP